MITISKNKSQTSQTMLKMNLVHRSKDWVRAVQCAHHDWISWDTTRIQRDSYDSGDGELTTTLMVLCTVERWSASGRPWVVGSISLATKNREDQTAGNGVFFSQNCDLSNKPLKVEATKMEIWQHKARILPTRIRIYTTRLGISTTNQNWELTNKNAGFDQRETKCPCHNRN